MNHPQGSPPEPRILLEDNHLLAVDKPAGLLAQGDATGAPSLVDWAREDLRFRYSKPGNVFVGLVHRLDQPVSGVVVLAKTGKAAARLSEQFRMGEVEKIYWAVVEGSPAEPEGEWADWLWKDERSNVVRTVAAGTPGSQEARLAFRIRAAGPRTSWIELRPATGRGHQLRVQLASRGLPIVGDRKYGSKQELRALDGGHRIALHARELRFTHPTRREAVSVVASVPADWPAGPSGG